MFDVDFAVKWSKRILKKGGLFYMDDFVGASRFQWSDEMLSIASQVRNILPDKFLLDPKKQNAMLDRNIKREDPRKVIKSDPSEAVESDKILDSVRHHFPDAKITLTGGAIYQLAFKDILYNFNAKDEYDAALIKLMLLIDQLCINSPNIGSNFATALAWEND